VLPGLLFYQESIGGRQLFSLEDIANLLSLFQRQ
jgi:hypothetical protein